MSKLFYPFLRVNLTEINKFAKLIHMTGESGETPSPINVNIQPEHGNLKPTTAENNRGKPIIKKPISPFKEIDAKISSE